MIKEGNQLKGSTNRKNRKPPASKKRPSNDASLGTRGQRQKFAFNLKVFIKNLPNDDKVDEVVRKHFEPCGEIIDFHPYHMEKLKHILVVFSSEDEADKATLLTGSLIEDRHIIVSKHRQYAVPTSKTVTISNLPIEIVEEDLWKFFEKCGTIKYIHIDRPLNAQSYQAQVHFKDLDSVHKALKREGKELKGSVISVSAHSSEDDKDDKSTTCYPVFVSGLPMDIKKEDLTKVFLDCGKIKRIKMKALKSHQEDMKPTQKATIFFMDEKAAQKAVEHSGESFGECICTVTQRESYQMEHTKFPHPLFVAGIGRDTKDVDLFFKFQECGLFEKIHFLHSPKGFLRKCIIAFKEPESVKKALAMKDLSLHGHELIVSDKKDILVGIRPQIKAIKRAAAQNESAKGKKQKLRAEESGSGVDESLSSSLNELSEGKKKKKKRKSQIDETDEQSEPTKGKKKKADTGSVEESGSCVDEALSSSLNELSEGKKKKKKRKSQIDEASEPNEDVGTTEVCGSVADKSLSSSLNELPDEGKKKKKRKSKVAG